MRRVLVKLVQNAINFSEKDGTVLVTGKAMNGKILINVIDEGSGISLEDSERIFEKYYQVEHPLEPKHLWNGLGVVYCQANRGSARGNADCEQPAARRQHVQHRNPS